MPRADNYTFQATMNSPAAESSYDNSTPSLVGRPTATQISSTSHHSSFPDNDFRRIHTNDHDHRVTSTAFCGVEISRRRLPRLHNCGQSPDGDSVAQSRNSAGQLTRAFTPQFGPGLDQSQLFELELDNSMSRRVGAPPNRSTLTDQRQSGRSDSTSPVSHSFTSVYCPDGLDSAPENAHDPLPAAFEPAHFAPGEIKHTVDRALLRRSHHKEDVRISEAMMEEMQPRLGGTGRARPTCNANTTDSKEDSASSVDGRIADGLTLLQVRSIDFYILDYN